jgi:hypothetical protein
MKLKLLTNRANTNKEVEWSYIYMESSNFCAHAIETKMWSKICVHALKTHTMCHNYWIYHKNSICVHALRMCTWSSVWVRFLFYLCELYTLFMWTIYAIHAKKTTIYGLLPTWKVGCWTGSLTDACGGGWPSAWARGRTWQPAWGVGAYAGAV